VQAAVKVNKRCAAKVQDYEEFGAPSIKIFRKSRFDQCSTFQAPITVDHHRITDKPNKQGENRDEELTEADVFRFRGDGSIESKIS